MIDLILIDSGHLTFVLECSDLTCLYILQIVLGGLFRFVLASRESLSNRITVIVFFLLKCAAPLLSVVGGKLTVCGCPGGFVQWRTVGAGSGERDGSRTIHR